jgi:hypothetical protein
MTYRVVNVTTGEIRAELHSFDQARELDDTCRTWPRRAA